MKDTAIALALMTLGAVVHPIEGLMIKKYNSRYGDGGFVTVAMIAFFSMLFFAVTDRDGFGFTAELIPYCIVSGTLFAAASFMTAVALGCGSFVLTNLFLSYSLIIPTGYGLIFLNESANPLTYIALAMMAVSIFFTQAKDGAPKDDTKRKTTLAWVVSLALSVICAGLFSVMQKLQQVRFKQSFDNEFMMMTLGFSAAMLFTIGIIKEGRHVFGTLRRGGGYALIAGLSNGATNLLNLTVNAMIPLSVAAPSRSGVTIVTSFLISLFVFGEKLSPRRTCGVIIGMAALILLNIN